MECHCCKKEKDWLERINPTGQSGIFYCLDCIKDHEEAIIELKSMTVEQLDLVPYEIKKWVCSGKNCNRGTKIRDYGTEPLFYHTRKSIGWFSLRDTFFMCAKHWKLYNRLKKNYPLAAIYMKMFDFEKQTIQVLEKKNQL